VLLFAVAAGVCTLLALSTPRSLSRWAPVPRTCTGDPNYDPAADFDDSGCVDLSDLAVLLSNYGTGT